MAENPAINAHTQKQCEVARERGVSLPISIALLSLAENFQKSSILFTALSLGLFAEFPPDGQTATEAAARSGISWLAARLLLNALGSRALCLREKGRYRVREDLRPLLTSQPTIDELLLYQRENGVWLRMASIFRGHHQAPPEYRRELLDCRISRYPGVQALNRSIARDIIRRIDRCISDADRVLDLGGGDGLYCGIILGMNSRIVVRVLDLESGLGVCLRHAEYLRSGRLELEAGDARTFVPSPEYDLVFVNELLELFPGPEKRQILRRAIESLRPGGHVVVTKFALNDNECEPGGSVLFSLRMRLKTAAGYLETDREVEQTLVEYGCVDVRAEDVQSLKTVIIGRRPEAALPAGADGVTHRNSNLKTEEDRTMTASAATEVRELPEQQLALWRELVGGATSFRLAAVLFAAAELDLFSHIPPAGCASAEAAGKTGVPEHSLRLLMNALSAVGILSREADRYVLHDDLRVLLAQGPHCVIPEILQYRRENQVWLNLPAILRNEPGARAEAAEVLEAAHLSEYLGSVKLTNHGPAAELTRRLGPMLSGARKVLDIGGGSGDYAKTLLAAGHDVKVTLLDRPEVIAKAQLEHEAEIRNGRIELVAGDALNFEDSSGYDIALISDLLHYFSIADKQRLIVNASRALAPRGAVVVSKFSLDDSGMSPAGAAVFSLKIHVKRPDAYLETDNEVIQMMRSAGLQDVTLEALDETKSMIVGRRAPQ
jgi:ubiquinone/menaquinone biosynthesis C-methylase UbiE